MQIRRIAYSAVLALLLPFATAKAQDPDTLKRSTITEHLDRPMLLNQQGISGTVNTEKITAVPSFLGNSDPISFVRLLPSVQLTMETEGGLFLQGSESCHTLITQGGVPLYGNQHLLGLFSVFNTPHYKGMDYATTAGQESRLGGLINMQLQDTVARRFSGDFSVGLLSAQGTVFVPTGKHSSLSASLRRTYVNLLYSSFLEYNGFTLHYGFTDANLTWLWRPSAHDRVTVDLFGGLDKGNIKQAIIENMEAQWYNVMGAVHWTHYFPSALLKQTVYATTYGASVTIDAFNINWHIPAFIRDYGYKGTFRWNDWEFGARFSYYDILPQDASSQGSYTDQSFIRAQRQRAFETHLHAQYSRILGYWLQLKASMGVNFYRGPDGSFFWGVTPEADLAVDLQEGGEFHLRYGLKRQNLFQLGLTTVGLPDEFWLAADSTRPPQYSHNFSLSYNADFLKGAWSVSAEIYYRQLFNQLSYVGTIMDLYYGNFSLDDNLAPGYGRAYGLNLMLQRHAGPVTGWISYAYSRSLRSFPSLHDEKEYSSPHERVHELDVVVTWQLNKKWDFGATFVMATGLPYTAPETLFVVGNRMVCEYGPYNGSRYPTYAKLDLSANFYLRNGPRGKTGFTFSLYNALGRKNATSLSISLNKERTAYTFAPASMSLRWLPSVAFFHTF